MNLLTDQWIPVRPLDGGAPDKITLQKLLCEDGKWDLYLPRDDMELAALQLLICITQALLTPEDADTLRSRIAKRITPQAYDTAIQPFADWFQLDHPKYPFMQVRGVNAKETFTLDKLMAGLAGATNCIFVNANDLAKQLCGGCVCIVLFNLGSCSPSFGGGFKPGLRGPASPITTLIQGRHLRETVWLNILNEESILSIMPWFHQTQMQKPTWIELIKEGDKIGVQQIGLIRGLFWQPACVEIVSSPTNKEGVCSCCGFKTNQLFFEFNRAQFRYLISNIWPHPHSPITTKIKKGIIEERHASFGTSTAPSWTQLFRILVKQQIDDDHAEGHQPASVIQQARKLYGYKAEKLHFAVGGYLNRAGLASIVGRRHEVFTINHGWDKNTEVIQHFVITGSGYRDALKSALLSFEKGIKKSAVKGSGIKLSLSTEAQYYRRTEPTIQDALARIDFENPEPVLTNMRKILKNIVEKLFDEAVRPYLNDPELIRTRAVARRVLQKHMKELEPQIDKGGIDGTTKNS